MSENNYRERVIQTAMMQLRSEASKHATGIELCLASPSAGSVDTIVTLAKDLASCDVAMRILQANLEASGPLSKLQNPQSANTSKFKPDAAGAEERLRKAKEEATKKTKKKKDVYSDKAST
jgi:hypothetical protein